MVGEWHVSDKIDEDCSYEDLKSDDEAPFTSSLASGQSLGLTNRLTSRLTLWRASSLASSLTSVLSLASGLFLASGLMSAGVTTFDDDNLRLG